ncbi:MAG: long-chain fatty acid--CoA ligase [Deltaproteobacteria bacterium]|nr:long-chain fatty acid--CoA ligase [Deltaproteobacteria bacterium]TLN01181.1 MAG: long-chain fatty acid--CoA ligase [bacterium]
MTTIDALLRGNLRSYPLNTALRWKEAGTWQKLSYGELAALADQIAAGLLSSGFAAGDRAALIGPSSPRWVAAYFGILRVGGIVVPVDKELKSAELRHILGDSEVRVIFGDRDQLDSLLEMSSALSAIKRIVLLHDQPCVTTLDASEKQLLRQVRDELSGFLEDLALSADQSARLRSVVATVASLAGTETCESPSGKKAVNPFFPPSSVRKELCRTGRLISFEEFCRAETLPEPSHTPEDTALILYTSGTTGRAKGAVLSHGNVVSNIRAAASRFSADSRMHTLSFLPINHVFEQVCGLLLPLSVGGTVSFAESLKKLGENLVEVRPTFFTGVPAVYRLFHDRIMKNIRGRALSKLLFSLPVVRQLVVSQVRKNFAGGTMFISGGASLDPQIARGLMSVGFKIFQGYGVTETSPVISAECPGKSRLGSVGPVLEGVEVKIAGAGVDGIGEILVRGPNVMQGYFKNPAATAEVLTGGWYHTGDLGRLDDDGFLFICGRVKNLIVTPNGKNVYPEEVEIELLKSPYIAEAMVFGHKIDAVSEEVHALIFPSQEALGEFERTSNAAPMTKADVEALIRSEVLKACKGLADYKRVKKFTLREDEFPKTTTRKIKRFAVEADVSIS